MNRKIGFTALRRLMSGLIQRYPDYRDKKKKVIELHDVVMSGFACMFYQEPSLLQFQKELDDAQHTNNLKTQFGVKHIPSATQMKDVLDNLSSHHFECIFDAFHKKMEKLEVIETLKSPLGTYLCPVDGTQYFTSKQIHCKKCLRKECKDGTHYFHQILQGAIVHPDKHVVLPLMPVEVSNPLTGIVDKQDCERRSFFRFLSFLKRSTLKLPLTILGDGLFADQPVVEAIRKQGFNFILTSKPDDNKFLHEEFWLITTQKYHFEYRDKKYLHCYSWCNQLPFNGKKQVQVNLIHYEMKKEKRPGEYEIVYKNSWVTDHELKQENIIEVVKAGRTRWRIENECFNNLKNQGYHLEHSYGHGEKFLSFNFILLTILAFYLHQFLEYRDEIFQACRKKFGSKRHLWETLRSYIKLLVFNSFEWLLEFALNKDKYVGENGLPLSRAGPSRAVV